MALIRQERQLDSNNVPPEVDIELRKIELERYKARLDYRKFVLASVFAAIAIAAIPPSFQLATAFLEYVKGQAQLRVDQHNREAERLAKQEEFRETYVKEFLSNALNQDIELRIRFAEYFAFVSADSFRSGWIEYRDSLLKHRDNIRKQTDTMEAEWQNIQRSGPDSPDIDRVERNLAWLYKEVGYVEKNRSVATNPRAPDRHELQSDQQMLLGAQLHALMVGISGYNREHAQQLRLKFASADAHDLANAILNAQGSSYLQVKLTVLLDEDASKIGIMRALSAISASMGSNGDDFAVVYFSGHATNVNGQLYLLPYDVDSRDSAGMTATSLSVNEFREQLSQIAARGLVLVLVDACDESVEPRALINALAMANVSVLTASRARQPAF